MTTPLPHSLNALPAGALLGFVPRRPIETPSVMVTPDDGGNHPPRLLAYYVNGWLRHHENLAGSAGDVWGRRNIKNQGAAPQTTNNTEGE